MLSHHQDRDHADDSADRWQSIADNLLPPLLGLIGIGALACGVWASGQAENTSRTGVEHCAAVADDRVRLACYDGLAVSHQSPVAARVPSYIHSQDGNQRDKP